MAMEPLPTARLLLAAVAVLATAAENDPLADGDALILKAAGIRRAA
jgi:hypothetical protein